jgi:serine/threonine protein kinase
MPSVRIYSKGQLRFQLDGLKIDRYTLVDRDGSKAPVVDGVYQINALGDGGFTVVARATDRLGLPRAIKFFLSAPHLFDESEYESNQFISEFRVVNSLPYKHILPIFDYGSVMAGGRQVWYSVSQYVSGVSLAEFNNELVRFGTLIIGSDVLRANLRDAMLMLVRDVLSGLMELHAASVFHLDIKPQNIVVHPIQAQLAGAIVPTELRDRIEAGGLTAFIVDMTAAKATRAELNPRPQLMWTPYYFPPLLDELRYEHSDGGIERETLDVHGRTIDLYSLGRTLEYVFLDRLRRRSPYVKQTLTLATTEPDKEAFWTTVFGDDLMMVETLIDRLMSLTDGFGAAERARRAFDGISFVSTQTSYPANEMIKKPPPPEARLRVFLCHATVDKPLVRDLYGKLKDDGIDVWLDEESLLPGEDWQEAIPKAVRSSHIVVVCLSKAAITKRGYVQKEIRFALDAAAEQPEGAIFLIPVRLEECEIPSQLSRWQWANLFGSGGYPQLMRSLRTRAEELGVVLADT